MSKPVRLGMIGCGFIAEAHGRAALKIGAENAAFTACSSRDEERREGFTKAFGCEGTYADYREMLGAGGIEALVIASPPVAHLEQIVAALQSGVRYILCEKPLSLTLAEAMEIEAAAQQCNATVVEAYHYRHNPLFSRVIELAADPGLGAIDHITGHVHLALPPPGEGVGWRRDPAQGGGVAHEYGCYPVDTLNILAGAPPVSVSAWMDDNRWRLYGRIRYANGVMGIIEASYNAAVDQSLSVFGRTGSFRVPQFWVASDGTEIERIEAPELFTRNIMTETIPAMGTHDGRLVDWPVYEAQLRDFLSAVKGEGPGLVSIEESVRNMAVIDGFIHSAETGCETLLSERGYKA